MYETLAQGRVPVVIADDWVEPSGIDWSGFTLRWPEDRAAELPAMLEANRHRWPDLARRASDAHRMFLSDQHRFDYMMSELHALVRSQAAHTFKREPHRDLLRWGRVGHQAIGRTRVTLGAARRRVLDR